MISPARRHHAFAAAAAAVASALAVTPAAPATAVPAAVAGSVAAATPAAATRPGCAAFAARSQADLVKITALDASALHPRLPALLDVRLASAQGTADSRTRPHRAVATARYADAELLGVRLPGSAATSEAPSAGGGGPVTATLAALDTGGPVTAEAGKSTAEARWDDAYGCGKPGPLTRSATMLAGIALLAGGGRAPAMQAVDRGTGTDRRTSLLRVGPTGSTQSVTDVVRLPDGRTGVSAGAGAALADVTLFGGTPQEIAVKVINQPTLTVVAGGRKPQVDYRPATLRVTAGGRPVGTLTAGHTSVGLDLFGRVTGAEKTSALGVKLSLGDLRRKAGGNGVRAEVAALRLEVSVGRAHVLDVALGYLFAEASAQPGGEKPQPAQPVAEEPAAAEPVTREPVEQEPAREPVTREPVQREPVAEKPAGTRPVAVEDDGALALTGTNAMVVGAAGGVLLLLGVLALIVVRRRPRRG